MNDNDTKVYKFHFKTDAKMKSELENVPLLQKTGTLSGLIVRLLDMMSPAMEEKHSQNNQLMSRYEFVCSSKDVERKSVYVNLPDFLYRKLKLMHQDLNFYSMAQLLRLVLRGFLGLAEVYGDAVESKLMAIYLDWKAQQARRKNEERSLKELLSFVNQKSDISSFLTLYSMKSQPISIYRL